MSCMVAAMHVLVIRPGCFGQYFHLIEVKLVTIFMTARCDMNLLLLTIVIMAFEVDCLQFFLVRIISNIYKTITL